MKTEMPTIEKKELKEFRVTRQAIVEFEFFVYAEDRHDAEEIVEELTSVEEYTDMFGVGVQDKYYDNSSDIAYIDRYHAGNGWWNSEDMHIEESGDDVVHIYKLEEDDWDDDYNVHSDEQYLIDAYKEEHGLIEDEDEIEEEQ